MFALILHIIIALAFGIYLICQSISDAKTQQVYTLPNDITVIITIMYGVLTQTVFNYSLIVIAVLLICGFLGYMGSGDVKALLSMYFVMCGDTFSFLIGLFVANLVFLIVEKFIKHKKRAAFFPYISVGYIVGCILQSYLYYIGIINFGSI